jgi:rhodanese-related sulfurtransferase
MLKLFFYTLLVFFQSYFIQDIDKHQVKNLLNNEVTVIDVRTEKEFKEGNIKTSFNLDFQKREFIDSLEKLDKSREYLIYCASGNKSRKASYIMKSLGFKVIYNYKKGYKDWIKD